MAATNPTAIGAGEKVDMRNGASNPRVSGRPPAAATGLALWLVGLLLSVWVASAPPAHAQKPAEASGPPLGVTVIMSSRVGQCYDPGDVRAVTQLARRHADEVNRRGGIAGRPLVVNVVDDGRDEARAIEGLRGALADPTAIAIVGMSNSNRAKAAFEKLSAEIRQSGMPILSRISVNSIFAAYPNVYTTQASQDEERLPVMTQFIKQLGFTRIAYIGLADTVFSSALGDGLAKRIESRRLLADHRLRSTGEEIDASSLAAAITDLKTKESDVLVLGTGGARSGQVVTELKRAGVTPQLLLAGRIDSIPEEAIRDYPNAIYYLSWERIPEADDDRLRRRVLRDPPGTWQFEGAMVRDAPGWQKGACQPRPQTRPTDPLLGANLRTIEIASQIADMVGLVAEAARTAAGQPTIAELRRHVLDQIATAYAAGRGAYRGSMENWSFHPKSRTAVRTPFVVILPPGLGRAQLAPVQFVRAGDGSLREIETLYVDVDLIRAHRIDDNEKAFTAEFYLSLRGGNGAGIEHLDFTNAYLDPRTNGRHVTIERLHDGGPGTAYPESMKIYKVSGRFVFEPDLADYPLDTQRFAIDIQPKRSDRPFVIQPPPASLRDTQVATDGWDVKFQYVGSDEDFVPVLDAFTHVPSVVPFFKSSFAWIMKRQTTDYYLRVVVPLAFILVVAYLSIFISLAHFEAIVTIQVTALLSAVALYLSLPKLDADSATLSDRIFVFNYMLVSLMIALSILRANGIVEKRPWLKGFLALAHVVAVPALVAAAGWHIYQSGLLAP